MMNDVHENMEESGYSQTDESPSHSPKPANISVLKYVTSELTRGYLLERDESKYTERRERVYTFMKTPRELEKFCIYGFFQCMDAFLFIFTFLPIRILMALLRLFTHPCGIFTARSQRFLESAHICDLLKGTILILCCVVFNHLDTSMMYHLVRGQSVIKLYVFYNMLDVCDRLFSGFGQDILDALFWTATEPKGKKREHVGVLPHLLLAVVYVLMHTMLILSQATVLNVAFNSHNKALLTIMMSNNFVEIKGSLFKRVDKNNLFQISCSDVKERFHYCVLLGIVFIRNMAEFSWNPDHLDVLLPDLMLVMLAELVVDWVKHAFVTKFNEISSEAYKEFTINLIHDMVTSRQKHAFTDHSDQVSRRMGFTPLPLACLLFRVCSRTFRISGLIDILILIIFYFCLLTLKVLTSILLLGHGSRLLSQQTAKTKKAAKTQEVDSQKIPEKEYSKKFTKPRTPETSPSPEPDADVVTSPADSATGIYSSTESVAGSSQPGQIDPQEVFLEECNDSSTWKVTASPNHVTLRQCQSDSSLLLHNGLLSEEREMEEQVLVEEVREEEEKEEEEKEMKEDEKRDEEEELMPHTVGGDSHKVVFDDIVADSDTEVRNRFGTGEGSVIEESSSVDPDKKVL